MDDGSATDQPADTAERFRREHRWAAWLCLLGGSYVLALSAGAFTAESNPLLVPRWIGAILGVVFLAAGLAIIKRDSQIANNALATVILALGAIVSGWAAVASPPGAISVSGLPFPLSDETRDTLGRVGFGVGALVCAGMTAYAVRRTLAAVRARH